MNKTHFFLTFIFVFFSLFIVSGRVSATVGGPTYISSIAFSAADHAVYYTVHDHGGRGCPPIIHKIDLTTLQDSEVKSCTQVEQEFLGGEYEQGLERYNQFISNIYQNLLYLGSVSLKKNDIDIDVELLSEHIEAGEIFWSEFRAILTQNNREVAKLNFRGCAKDQPHIFEGYRIPNGDALAIVISNKGDCFEGGYVKESLSIVGGITYTDTTMIRSIKEPSATEPNQGNMVVYAASDDAGNDEDKNNSMTRFLWIIALFFVVVMMGYLLGKKSLR